MKFAGSCKITTRVDRNLVNIVAAQLAELNELKLSGSAGTVATTRFWREKRGETCLSSCTFWKKLKDSLSSPRSIALRDPTRSYSTFVSTIFLATLENEGKDGAWYFSSIESMKRASIANGGYENNDKRS